MSDKPSFSLPMWALILDVIGTLLLAAGLVGMFMDPQFPSSLPVDLGEMAIVLIILGVLLMVPLIVVVIQRAVSPK